jgi:hypothetical protein
MNDFVVLVLIFGNLMISFWKDQRKQVDGKESLRSAMQRYSTANRERGHSKFGADDRLELGTGITPSQLSGLNSDVEMPEDGDFSRHAVLETTNSPPPRAQVKFDSGANNPAAPAPKRVRPPESWAGLTLSHVSDAETSSVDPVRAHCPKPEPGPMRPQPPRERPPDSWGGMNFISGFDDSVGSMDSATEDHTSSSSVAQQCIDSASKRPTERPTKLLAKRHESPFDDEDMKD